MYDYLDSHRNKLWGEKIKLLSNSIKNAEKKHEETE